MVDGIPESPEEGDYTGDTIMLSEAEGEELDQPRTRSASFPLFIFQLGSKRSRTLLSIGLVTLFYSCP
jgi:hypothetical protein